MTPSSLSLQPLRQRVVRGIGVGEERVAAAARHRQRVKLRRLERRLVVGAVGVPALGAAPVDLVAQSAVGVEFVDAEHRDLGMIRMARRFRWVRRHWPKTLAIRDEVRDRQLLVPHDHHIVVEPSLVDLVPGRLVHRLDVDTGDFDANLRPHPANLEHIVALRSSTSWRVNTCTEKAATLDSAMPTRDGSIARRRCVAPSFIAAGRLRWACRLLA